MANTVTNRKTGNSFTVKDGETILDAALSDGKVFPYSCRSGTCGTCLSDLISGDVRYADGRPDAISEEDISAGKVLLCQAHPQGDVEINANEIATGAAVSIRILPCRVMEMNKVADDVMQIFLKLPQNQYLEYLAGQYVDILLRDGKRRSFSIANRPVPDQLLELHIRQVEGGRFSSMVFQSMKQRDLLRFQGPFGTFFLRAQTTGSVVLMAGGTGLAPIKAIIEQAAANGTDLPFHLYWGARTRKDLYLHEELNRMASQLPFLSYVPVLSEADGDDWNGRTGWVHEAVLADFSDMQEISLYTSGPPQMINAARPLFEAAGLDPDRYYYDSFEYAADA